MGESFYSLSIQKSSPVRAASGTVVLRLFVFAAALFHSLTDLGLSQLHLALSAGLGGGLFLLGDLHVMGLLGLDRKSVV